MSEESIVYELSLKDGLSSKVKEADDRVNHLEHSMHNVQESGLKMAEAFGISFAIFKGVEMVHEGIESMEKVHQAEAQLQNTMENMGRFSEESMEKAISAAGELSKNIKFSRADVIELQSQLGLVGNIGEEEMGRLTKVSADLATKMGMGLSEAGNLLAKAINAPEMARRLGMSLKIDPGIMEHIQDLAKHGKEAQARMELLAIAESKVGGAAEAAFNADPLARFNKTMASIKNEIGDLAISFLKRLAPALEWISGAFRDATKWVKEHKMLVEIVGSVLLGLAVSIGTIVTVTKIWTAVQWALNAAIDANPISKAIVIISALAGVVIYCYNHFAIFRGVVWGTWAVIKEVASLIGDAFKSVYHIIHGAFTFNWDEVKQGWKEGVSVVTDAAHRIGAAAKKGYEEGMADFKKSETESLIPHPTKKPGAVANTTRQTEPKTKAGGTKNVTINVHIQKLGETHLNVTNLKEGMGKIRETVLSVLTGAMNDMQIVADH